MIELLNWISNNREVAGMIATVCVFSMCIFGYIIVEIINAIKK